MTESEWQEIESIVRKTTIQTVQGIFESEETAELEKSQAMRLEKKAARKKELLEIAGLIKKGMERYRTEPPEGTIRPVIDWLLRKHALLESDMQRDGFFKERHNAMVLKYVIKSTMTNREIQKMLGMTEKMYESQLRKGMYELAQIFVFGKRMPPDIPEPLQF
jgi:hypothetical protein